VIIGEVSRKDATDQGVLDLYNAIFGPDRDPTVERGTATGSPGTYWTVIANSPATVEMVMATTKLMSLGEPGFRLYKELGLVRASWARGSQFTFSQHSKALRGLGVPDAKIHAIRYWQHSEHYTAPVERLVLGFADDLTGYGGRVPDETMVALREHFTDAEILDLTYTIALWEMHSVVCKALRVEFDDRDDPIVEIGGDIGNLSGRSDT
jgi:alkylhydroperoxidase family enzyme